MGDKASDLVLKRANELAARAERTGLRFHTEFLTVSEQSAIRCLRLPTPCAFFGGYPNAERTVAAFGEDATETDVLDCIEIAPKQQKFADSLTHRDFLGALMNLGVKRETLGDIVIVENKAYLFCLKELSDFILNSLERVKHTSVQCRLSDPPAAAAAPPEPISLVVSSDRADALLSAAFRLSREESKQAVSDGRMYINGRQCFQAAAGLKVGDMISLRGAGRVEYLGPERETKRGRLRVLARVYA